MAFQSDAFYHLCLLFVLSLMVIPLKRSGLVAFVLVFPALTEITQFFMPGRVPDFMDAFHGYLGILLAYSLVEMWREIAPVVKKIADSQLRIDRSLAQSAERIAKKRGHGEDCRS